MRLTPPEATLLAWWLQQKAGRLTLGSRGSGFELLVRRLAAALQAGEPIVVGEEQQDAE